MYEYPSIIRENIWKGGKVYEEENSTQKDDFSVSDLHDVMRYAGRLREERIHNCREMEERGRFWIRAGATGIYYRI